MAAVPSRRGQASVGASQREASGAPGAGASQAGQPGPPTAVSPAGSLQPASIPESESHFLWLVLGGRWGWGSPGRRGCLLGAASQCPDRQTGEGPPARGPQCWAPRGGRAPAPPGCAQQLRPQSAPLRQLPLGWGRDRAWTRAGHHHLVTPRSVGWHGAALAGPQGREGGWPGPHRPAAPGLVWLLQTDRPGRTRVPPLRWPQPSQRGLRFTPTLSRTTASAGGHSDPLPSAWPRRGSRELHLARWARRPGPPRSRRGQAGPGPTSAPRSCSLESARARGLDASGRHGRPTGVWAGLPEAGRDGDCAPAPGPVSAVWLLFARVSPTHRVRCVLWADARFSGACPGPARPPPSSHTRVCRGRGVTPWTVASGNCTSNPPNGPSDTPSWAWAVGRGVRLPCLATGRSRVRGPRGGGRMRPGPLTPTQGGQVPSGVGRRVRGSVGQVRTVAWSRGRPRWVRAPGPRLWVRGRCWGQLASGPAVRGPARQPRGDRHTGRTAGL